MNITELAIFLGIGAVAGWLAGLLMKGQGFGLIGNIIIGIIGAFIGSYVFSYFGISLGLGLMGQVIKATVGASVLLLIISIVKKV